MRNYTDGELESLYEIAEEKPGWLSKLRTNMNISEDDEAYLVWLDDCMAEPKKRLKQWEEQIEREGGPDIALAEDDNEKLTVISRRIAAIEETFAGSERVGAPYLTQAIFLINAGYDRLKKLRGKIRAGMIHIEHPDYAQVTEHDITRAREYPLEDLVELDRQKRMLCHWHKDKSPSMWVKNGFGYCFTCGAWCDSLRYLMEVKRLKFVEAVKQLAGWRAAA